MELIFIIFLIVTGLFAGFMAGLLGVGGGFIFAPAMYFVLRSSGVPDGTAILVAFGTSLAVAMPTILTSALGHLKRGNVVVKNAVFMGLFGAAFSILGARAAGVLPVRILTVLFACLLVIAAIRLVTKLPAGGNDAVSTAPAGAIGAAAGFFSGLLGVGGGTVLVPLLTVLGKFSMKRAVGTSSLGIVFITAGGIIAYIVNGLSASVDLSSAGFFVFGYLELTMWGILVVCAVPMAFLSVRLSGKIPDKMLRWMFFALMIFIALDMFGVFELIGGLF